MDFSDNFLSDMDISAAIKAKYFTDPDIEVLNIKVETADGIVTLTGDPIKTKDHIRERAILIAKSIEGVKDARFVPG